MSLIRPPKDKRSMSVNEVALTASKSKQRISTPFLRHESVVEVLEKKQREGLKNRLKMLHTTVLPSRTVVSTNLPVIVKAPVRTLTLPRNPQRKGHYRSVLGSTSDPTTTTAEEPSRMTRRHSFGGLISPYRDEGKSPSDINGDNFKNGNFYPNKFSGNKDKNISGDSKFKGVPNSGSTAKFLIAKDDSHLDKKSPTVTFKPFSTTQREILTKPPADEKFKEAYNIGAKTNGNFKKPDDDKVFSLRSNEGDLELDENLNYEQKDKVDALKVNPEKPDMDYKINGHQDDTVKLDSSGPDIVEILEAMSLTNSENSRATEEFWNTELHTVGNGEASDNGDKSLRSSFSTDLESSLLVVIDDAINTTSSASLSPHNNDIFELGSEKSEHHILATIEHTPYPDIVNSCQGETEVYVTFEKVKEDKKLEESTEFRKEHQNARENALNENAEPKIKELAINGMKDFSDESKKLNKNDDKNEDEVDAFWSVVENSFKGSVETTPRKSRSEPIEVEIQKCPDSGLGFCIEGGKESPVGDRPITVKRVFQAAMMAQECLKEGDEILMVASRDTSNMKHFEAWQLLRSLPNGPVKMTIIRRED